MRNAATVPPHLCAIDATGASWLTSIGMPPLTTGSRSGSSDGPARIILVVENDVLIRMPLAEYLRERGYRVFEAADVAEAKAVLNADTQSISCLPTQMGPAKRTASCWRVGSGSITRI